MPSIDTVPDGDVPNITPTQGDTGTSDDPAGDSQPEAQQPARPAHDTQGDTGTSADPADDFQPLDINENSTAYSLPRWRKLLRSVFGIQQRGFQVGGMLARCCIGGNISLRGKGMTHLTMSRDFQRISGMRKWVHLRGYGGHTLKNAAHLIWRCWKDGGTDWMFCSFS